MCGIAGFSLTQHSNIKPRQLANALLCAIEDRGGMASGYAWQDREHMGFYKAPVTGSKLSLKGMPKNVKNVILHTRLATHGSTQDNRNNHPVLSPSEDIALVHNGVIYNHTTVRKQLDISLPDVDTSVIPAIIEQWGLDQIDNLDGDAAIAWFNRKEHDTLHLARYQHSPLVMAQVEDGSFIFASTEQLLWRVLIQLDLMPIWMETASELDYYTISNGVVTSKSMLPQPKYSGYGYDTTYYRHQTSGAKGIVGGSEYSDLYYYGDEDDWDTYPSGAVSPSYDDYADEDDDVSCDVASVTAIHRVKYYTVIYDQMMADHEVLYYYPEEENTWKDELFIWAQEPNVQLVDYGKVEKGELVSTVDELF